MTDTVAPYDLQAPVPVPTAAIPTVVAPQLSNAGPQATQATAEVFAAMARETDRYAQQLDAVSAQDALNQLRAKRQELTLDPTTGFMRLKGKDAIGLGPGGKSLLVEIPDNLKAAADGLGSKLSPAARALFNRHVGPEVTGFTRDLLVHQTDQAEKYEAAVFKDGISQDANEAARVYDDAAKVGEIVARTRARAEQRAAQLGQPGKAAADAAESDIHVGVIKQLVAANANRQALAYYDINQNKLDAKDRAQMAAAMKTLQNGIESENLANQALTNNNLPAAPSDDTSKPGTVPAARTTGQRTQDVSAVLTGAQRTIGNAIDINRLVTSDHRPDAKGSQHQDGNALDIDIRGLSETDQRRVVDALLSQPGAGGFGYYNNGLIHVDARKGQRTAWGTNHKSDTAFVGWPAWMTERVKAWQSGAGMPRPSWQGEGDTQPPGAPPIARGDMKSAFTKAQLDILQNPNIPLAIKTGAAALVAKHGAALTAFRDSEVKSLDDRVDATVGAVVANPALLKPGMFSAFADQYDALGEQGKAMRFRMFSQLEGVFKDGLGSATDQQLALISRLSSGLAKDLVDAYTSGNTHARSEALRLGNEKVEQIKKSIAEGVAPSGMVPLAKEAMADFAKAGKAEKSRELADYLNAANEGQAIANAPPTAASKAIADITDEANRGVADQNRLQVRSFAQTMFERQKARFDKDPLGTGASVYPQVGKLAPINWTGTPDEIRDQLALRANQARQVSDLREGMEVPPLTPDEIAQFKNILDQGPPDQQGALLRRLALAPPSTQALLARKLAGGNDALANAYASAFALYSEQDPARAAVGDEVLRGAAIIRGQGDGGRKPAETSEAWQTRLQERLGGALIDMGRGTPAMVADAIAAVYVYRMNRAGRQGEKAPDTDILDKAITAVVGNVIDHNGQKLLPPKPGMTDDEWRGVLGRLTDADMHGAKSLEGDPVTADLVRRRGILTNVADGLYLVRVPDPRTGRPAEIPDPTRADPKTGKPMPLLIDGKDLMRRETFGPMRDPNAPDYITAPPLGGRR